MGNLRDKNDRAIKAYLQPVVAAVNASIQIYISNDSAQRKIVDKNNNPVGLVDVKTVQGPEAPLGSGNYTFHTIIGAKFPAAVQPGGDPNGPDLNMGALISAIHDSLHLSDNNQDYHATARLITVAGNNLASIPEDADDSDMANYSCLSLVHTNLGGGQEPGETKKESEINFIEFASVQTNVAGYGGYWN